jgi:hypothetical protein
MTWRNCSTPSSSYLALPAPCRSQPVRPTDGVPSTERPPVPVGTAVFSGDGRRLGVIKAIRHGCFLVDARFAFDYWLPWGCVALVTPKQVTLAITKRDIPRYLVDIDCPDDLDSLPPLPHLPRTEALRGARVAQRSPSPRRFAARARPGHTGWMVSRST